MCWLLFLPPPQRATTAAGNNDSAREQGYLWVGQRSAAATPSASVRSDSCQLQSGLLIKPHETNKAHFWRLQEPVRNAGTRVHVGSVLSELV